MRTIIITMFLSLYGSISVPELYKMGKYNDVIQTVSDKSTVEDKTYKLYSYYKLGNYVAVCEMGKKLIVGNQSDSLKTVLAISSYYLDKNEDLTFYSSLIESSKCQNELSRVLEHYSMNSFVIGNDYLPLNTQGFCFDNFGKVIYAIDNKLVLDGKTIYVSDGKYVSYPFIKNERIYFSGNLKKGELLTEKELASIGRDRISKLQLFVGNYINGIVTNVELLPFNNIEYDFISPFIDENDNIYFSSNLAGGYGGYDLYRYDKETGTVKNLGEQFNTVGNETCYSEFKNKVYFSSDKAGLGKLDIWSCMRNSKMYGNFINMGEGVNTRFTDFNFLVYNKKGYYSSMGPDGTSKIRFVDNINPKSESSVVFKNKFNDSLVNVSVYSSDYGNGIVYHDSINNSSATVFVDKQYSVDYGFDSYGYEREILNGSQLIEKNEGSIYMTPKFYGVIEDYITGEPISGVDVIAVKGTDTIRSISDKDGKWFLPIEENDGWSISIGKNGYKYKSYSGKELNVHALRNVVMGMDNKKGTKLEIRNIYFAFGKSDISPESIEVLDRIFSYMIENPDIKFEISAHTDSRGGDAANLKLSVNRALSAYGYLINKGISESRMTYKGYGETIPVNQCVNGSNCSEDEYQLNRRVEIKIL